MKPTFFKFAAEFRAWLEKHHATRDELYIGMYRISSGKGGITYKEALDQALCFGWIDGVRKSVDATSFCQRFTPRKPKSHWSRVNLKRWSELEALGLVTQAGRDAHARRDESKTINYSYEVRAATFPPAFEKKFKANKKAWAFFTTQAPSYQRVAKFMVMSAKQAETRVRRLDTLIAVSANGSRLGPGRTKT